MVSCSGGIIAQSGVGIGVLTSAGRPLRSVTVDPSEPMLVVAAVVVLAQMRKARLGTT